MRAINNAVWGSYSVTRNEWQAALIHRRDEFARYKALVDGATILDQVLCELQSVITTEGDTVLTIRAAATRSGYSAEHLARLVRDGTIQNVGRKGSPRIRLRDVPIKPKATVAKAQNVRYDPRADARFVRADQR